MKNCATHEADDRRAEEDREHGGVQPDHVVIAGNMRRMKSGQQVYEPRSSPEVTVDIHCVTAIVSDTLSGRRGQ
jgi:hypothetical protein